MAILPNPIFPVKLKHCSACGKHVGPNQYSLWYDGGIVHRPSQLLIGDCCADRFMGALIQDYAVALRKYSATCPAHWIKYSGTQRMLRVIKGAGEIAKIYQDAIDMQPYLPPELRADAK